MIIMKLMGAPSGPTGHDGEYLMSFDFEAWDGVGEIVMTPDPSKAKAFRDYLELREFYLTQPKIKPYRADGLPNRPLTATNWELVNNKEVAQ